MVDAVRLLEGMERMLARRARPIPVHVMRRCLRVAAEALRAPPPAKVPPEATSRQRPRASAATPDQRAARKRARQAAWKRDKTARLRAERAAEAAQVGLADAVAESPLHIAIDRALAPDVTVLAPVPPAPEAALPPPAAPRPARDEGESVATTHKAVREYLVGRLIASGVGKLLAADRVTAPLIETIRRAILGLST